MTPITFNFGAVIALVSTFNRSISLLLIFVFVYDIIRNRYAGIELFRIKNELSDLKYKHDCLKDKYNCLENEYRELVDSSNKNAFNFRMHFWVQALGTIIGLIIYFVSKIE